MTEKVSAMRANARTTPVAAALKSNAPKQLVFGLLLAAATFALLSMMAPRHQGEATLAILVKGEARSIAGSQGSISVAASRDAVEAGVRALTSPELIEKIVDELELKHEPEFNAALGPIDPVDRVIRAAGLQGPLVGESERDRVMNAFRRRLEVYPGKEIGVIGVRFTSLDPMRAAAIANLVAEAYQATLVAHATEEGEERAALQAEIDKLTTEAAAADAQLDRYSSMIDAPKGFAQKASFSDQRLTELNGELTGATALRKEADARAKEAREMMKLGSADAVSNVQNSPLVQNLIQQRARLERQISELSATLLPGHPRMQLNAELGGLKRQLEGEILKVVEGLESEAKVAQGREDGLRKTLEDMKIETASKGTDEAKLREFRDDAKVKRGELDRMRIKLDAATGNAAPSFEAQVISKAQPPAAPAFPQKTPMSALVAVAWMLFGTAWTMTRALFAGARGANASEADDPDGASNFASHDLPAARRAPAKAAVEQRSADAPDGSMAAVAKRLADKRLGESGHRTLVTGESAGLDASAEAVDLAAALAAAGLQVVLIDWSRSGAGMAGYLSAESGPGLTELLLGQAGFENVIVRGPGGGAHFIRCGAPLKTADIDPDLLNLVLDALDEAYQHIVVAGPHDDARALFEAIEGRFDAAIAVAEAGAPAPKVDDPARWFLEFEVTEIDVMRFERKPAPTAVSSQRLARVMRRSGTAA